MDKTKQKIQELVPEIMELKFGCEVGHTKTNQQWIVLCAEKCGSVICWHKNWDRLETPYYTHKSVLEILGRPITLADVLLAIGTNTHPKPKLELWSVQLEMYMIDDDGNNLLWDLTKTYDDQSQETKDFIGEILGVK